MKAFVLKSFTGLFIIQMVFANLDLCCELQKLPSLLEHYEEHMLTDGLSFSQFLDLHYGMGEAAQQHHHGDDHDANLPFSGHHQCHCPGVVATPNYYGLGIAVLLPSETTAWSIYQFSVSSAFPDSPFQPPRA